MTTRIYMKPEDFPPPDEMHKYLCVYLYFHKNEAPEPYFIYNTEHDPTLTRKKPPQICQ